ncbi:MAG: FAD-dependent oxidoreductase [Defluviitaleaceae bacterium]|nr:FAD-dependent oxidoreductase [Defluviitaleaceae bacterium]
MIKIVIVGANHAGTAAANTILDNYKGVQVVIFDQNSNISYLGCGTALYVGRQIEDTDGLFYSSRELLEKKGAKVYLTTTVEDIDFDKKIVTAVNAEGREIQESYDKVILATGSAPIRPNLPGVDLGGVHFVKLFQDGSIIDKELDDPRVKRVATVGAGYIGVEIAEAIQRRGKESMLFELAPHCLGGYYDEPFTLEMDKVLKKGGIDLHYSEGLKAIKSEDGKKVSAVLTDKGEYPAEMVLLAIGFVPRTEVGNGKIELGAGNAFKVDLHQQTSIPDVYAVGDCATIFNNATKESDYIALATNAVRSGIVAGHNVCGTALKSAGVQGSNGICIYDYKMFSTGLSYDKAKAHGFKANFVDFEDYQKPEFVKADNGKVKLRIVYCNETRRILGAQMASYMDVSMGLHMFSLAIAKEFTINELPLLDIFFMPHFNKPFNYITMAGLLAK